LKKNLRLTNRKEAFEYCHSLSLYHRPAELSTVGSALSSYQYLFLSSITGTYISLIILGRDVFEDSMLEAISKARHTEAWRQGEK